MERIVTRVSHLPILTRRKRVAAYTRVSSGKDAMLHSMSAQISYYSAKIQEHEGWEYVGVYADEAMTGTKDNRESFQRLLEDCRSGKIDIILTKSISRFARNTVTLLQTVRELKGMNVDVYFEEQNIHSMSCDGEMMLTILASYAQEESRSASENCLWRIRRRFKCGDPTGFRVYGYRIVHGIILIDPMEAEVVRLIFRLYREGNGTPTICRMLEEMGISAPEGDVWHPKTVGYILRNEKYIGDLLLQKNYVADHLTKHKKINKGELPKYYVSNNHEGIVAVTEFGDVGALYDERSKKYSGANLERCEYPYTSLMRCGICGANYRRKVAHSTIYSYPVWICTTYNNKGKKYCASKRIPESILVETTENVLGTHEPNREQLLAVIDHIEVTGPNELHYVFQNGKEQKVVWEDRSRRDSWTMGKRMKAAEFERKRKAI